MRRSLNTKLFCRNIFVYVLATNEGIEEDIEQTCDWYDVGNEVVGMVC